MEKQNEENQSKKEKQILNNYDNAMNKALSVLQGKAFRPVSKVDSKDVKDLMDEFFAEEIQSKKEEFKNKFKQLLVEKTELDKFIKQKETEFKNSILNKKKEFTEKVNNVLNIIDGIDQMKKDYLTSLNNTEDDQSEEEVE